MAVGQFMSPDPLMNLIKDLTEILKEVDHQIDAIKKDAEEMGIDPYVMKNTNGEYVLADVLMTKADLLMTLRDLRYG